MDLECLYIMAKYEEPIPAYKLKVGDIVIQNILGTYEGQVHRKVQISAIKETSVGKRKLNFFDQDGKILRIWHQNTLTARYPGE
jgi:hypothetical protein